MLVAGSVRVKIISAGFPPVMDKVLHFFGFNVNPIEFEYHYRTSLFNKQQFTHKMTRIQPEKHQLYTMEIEKKSLNPFNDKKYIMRDGDIL